MFLLGFGILPIQAVLYTFSDDSAWLIGVQLLDGVGAGVFGALSPLVVADLMSGTGRYALGAIATVHGIGASVSGLVTGEIVDHFGYTVGVSCVGGCCGSRPDGPCHRDAGNCHSEFRRIQAIKITVALVAIFPSKMLELCNAARREGVSITPHDCATGDPQGVRRCPPVGRFRSLFGRFVSVFDRLGNSWRAEASEPQNELPGANWACKIVRIVTEPVFCCRRGNWLIGLGNAYRSQRHPGSVGTRRTRLDPQP